MMVSRRNALNIMLICAPLAINQVLIRRVWANDGLLDPDNIGKNNLNSANINIIPEKPYYNTATGSDMMTATYSSIMGLIATAVSKSNEYYEIDKKVKALKSKIDKSIADKESKLNEYRQGLFCSGCNQTKSQILAKGENFPHAGQSIIRPTQQQIDDFEKKLQKIIDDAINEEKAEEINASRASKQAKDIYSQILEGIRLWRAAAAFSRKIISYNDMLFALALQNLRQSTIYDLNAAISNGTKSQLQPEIIENYKKAIRLSTNLMAMNNREHQKWQSRESDISSLTQKANSQLIDMKETSQRRSQEIKDFMLASEMRYVHTNLTGTIEEILNAGVLSILTKDGQYFRFGDTNPNNFGVILPRVAMFLAKFDEITLSSSLRSQPSNNITIDPFELSISELKQKINITNQ